MEKDNGNGTAGHHRGASEEDEDETPTITRGSLRTKVAQVLSASSGDDLERLFSPQRLRHRERLLHPLLPRPSDQAGHRQCGSP